MESLESRPAGGKLYSHQNMARAEIHPFLFGQVSVFSRQCPESEKNNEDSLLICPINESAGLLAVADGMGGMAKGDIASRIVLDTLLEFVTVGDTNTSPLRNSVLDAIETANTRVIELGVGAGTTLSVLEFDENKFRSYQIGDSVILAVGQRGKIKLETLSHSPVGYAVESGLLEAAAAINHQDRHMVSNFIGSSELKIEVGSWFEFSELDTIILATDGLTDNLHIPEIVDTIRTGKLEAISQNLVTLSTARMGVLSIDSPCKPDDLSFVVFRGNK